MISKDSAEMLLKASDIILSGLGYGEYKETLESARHYQAVESFHRKMNETLTESIETHANFLNSAVRINMIHDELKMKSIESNDDLKTLYDSI